MSPEANTLPQCKSNWKNKLVLTKLERKTLFHDQLQLL